MTSTFLRPLSGLVIERLEAQLFQELAGRTSVAVETSPVVLGAIVGLPPAATSETAPVRLRAQEVDAPDRLRGGEPLCGGLNVGLAHGS